jgi:hypothetical protein
VNSRRVASFVEAVLSDRRPGPFEADPVDADVLRVAIAMRAARPGAEGPDERFVAQLRQELALEGRRPATTAAHPPVTRRARLMLGATAVVSMLGGTVAATTTVDHALAASGAPHASSGQLLRMGTFRSPDGQAVGQLVAYRGNPSWVFMSIRDPGMNGTVRCRLETEDGQTAATGKLLVYNGKGEWARPLSADISRIRGATLSTASGSTLAVAAFSTA